MSVRYIDLHTHTTASDGSDSPAKVVRQAAALSLAALAITDHDTLSGLAEAEAEARLHTLEFIRGCEISTRSGVGEVHLLGLWIPASASCLEDLERVLAQARNARDARNRIMADRLVEMGIPAPYEAVVAVAGGDVVGRPHFAELLIRLGVVNSRRQAFEQYLGSAGKVYEPRDLPSPEEGVAALAACAPCVSLAHPCLGGRNHEAVAELVARLVPQGLTAIEAYHSEHTARDVRWCVELARTYNLGLTGGSDYHGAPKPRIRLGKGKGGLRVTTAVLDDLKARMSA